MLMPVKKLKLHPLKWVFILWFYALKSVKDENDTLASSQVRHGKTGEERIADIADSALVLTIGSILITLSLSTFRLTYNVRFHWVKLGVYIVYAILFGIIYWLIIRRQRWKKIILAYPIMHFTKAGVLLSIFFMCIVIMGAVFSS